MIKRYEWSVNSINNGGKSLSHNKEISIISIIKLIFALTLLVLILCYFFWPKTIKFNIDEMDISINKGTEGVTKIYDLNEQEVHDLVNILKKSRFYNGVSKPDKLYNDNLIVVIVRGGEEGVFSIYIYYDTNKTYVYASISNYFTLNDKYRISNKDDIRIFIENIINNPDKYFAPIPSS